MRRSVTAAQREVAEKARDKARALTSGGVSSRQLAALGHPYGRGPGRNGRPRARLALLPVHRQSGALQRSLRLFSQRGGQEWRLQFTSPHAVVLSPGGTGRMRARGFWTALRKYVLPLNRRSLLAAKRAAERG